MEGLKPEDSQQEQIRQAMQDIAQGRRSGRTRLVYDKQSKTIKAVLSADAGPPTAISIVPEDADVI